MNMRFIYVIVILLAPVYAYNVTCSDIHTIPVDQRCQFIQFNQCSQGFINYSKLYYCDIQTTIPFGLILLLYFVTLGIISSEYLCPNLYVISKNYLRINDNLTGLTLLAFGNSSPDIFSSYQAIKLDSINLAISELIGASLFITTIVIGSIAMVKPFTVSKNLFIRDLIMYIVIISLLIIAILIRRLSWIICVCLIGLYILYVGGIVYIHKSQKSRRLAMLRDYRLRSEYRNENVAVEDEYMDDNLGLPTIDDVNLQNEVDRVFDMNLETNDFTSFGLKSLIKELQSHSNLGPIQLTEDGVVDEGEPESESHFIYFLNPQLINFNQETILGKCWIIMTLPISIILTLTTPVLNYQKYTQLMNLLKTESVLTFRNERILLTIQTFSGLFMLLYSFSNIVITFLISLISSYLIYSIHPDSTQSHSKVKYMNYFQSGLGFIISIKWISLVANEIINVLNLISLTLSINDDLLGITIFALGNSVGDFISNFTIARMELPLIAFSACFGGPIMAISFLGVSGLMQSSNQELKMSTTLVISSIGLLLNLLLLLWLVPRNQWMLDRRIGTILFINYTICCTLSIIIERY